MQPHPPRAPRGIEVVRNLHRHTAAAAVQHQHVVPRGDQQQLGQSRAQHDPGITAGDPVLDPYVAVEADAGGDGAVDQARQQPRLLLVAALLGEHRRSDNGGHKGSGRHRTAEFFDYHDKFRQSVAGAAVTLVDVQAEPTELDHVLPEGWSRLIG